MNVIPRQAWDAAAPLQPPSHISGPVSKIFVHHTVTASGPPEREAELVRQVQQIAFDRGFNDISYSYLIFPTGNTTRGAASASSEPTPRATTRRRTPSAWWATTRSTP